MKFLLDENADFRLLSHLVGQGHDVTAVAHDYPHALSDQDVLALALEERRVLITNDRDFGELIFRQGLRHAGVILFRLRDVDIDRKLAGLERALAHSRALEQGAFLVVSEQAVRVRRRPLQR